MERPPPSPPGQGSERVIDTEYDIHAEYDPLAPIVAKDKHKVLQTLTNRLESSPVQVTQADIEVVIEKTKSNRQRHPAFAHSSRR